jgi:urease accessory protein UreH
VSNIGLAELTVQLVAGWSVVTEQYSQAPLQLHRPLYLDLDTYPTVFLKTPSSGLLGGDQHQLTVRAAENSTVKIVNQSATLVYPGASQQTIDIDIASGGTVYFEPCPLILAAGANLTQKVRIEMSQTSCLRYIDEWSAGRIAMNECWRFERFDNTIEIFIAGSLAYRERFVLEPLKAPPDHALIGHHFTRFRSVYHFGPWQDSQLTPKNLQKDLQKDLQKEQHKDLQPDLQSVLQTEQEMDRQNDSRAWRLTKPCGTIDRLLSMPSACQATVD